MLKLALPSDRQMEEPTLRFMEYCGLAVSRSNSRSYTGSLGGVPGVSVLFQRSADIPAKLEDGSADLGIVGLDRFLEDQVEGGDIQVVLEDLGYSNCELVIGLPESWIDISSISDLAELAPEFHDAGHDLRIATKYPRLTQEFMMRHGVAHFEIVSSAGAMEVAPAMGYSDIIVDIMSTGNTLRENHLKTVEGGTIVKSQACLIANGRLLAQDRSRLASTRVIVSMMEGRLRARDYYSIVANVRGSSESQVAEYVMSKPHLAGVQGPTIARVYSKDGKTGWYSITIVVPKPQLMAAVEHLHGIGGAGVTVLPAQYVFEGQSPAYSRLLARLKKTNRTGFVEKSASKHGIRR